MLKTLKTSRVAYFCVAVFNIKYFAHHLICRRKTALSDCSFGLFDTEVGSTNAKMMFYRNGYSALIIWLKHHLKNPASHIVNCSMHNELCLSDAGNIHWLKKWLTVNRIITIHSFIFKFHFHIQKPQWLWQLANDWCPDSSKKSPQCNTSSASFVLPYETRLVCTA